MQNQLIYFEYFCWTYLQILQTVKAKKIPFLQAGYLPPRTYEDNLAQTDDPPLSLHYQSRLQKRLNRSSPSLKSPKSSRGRSKKYNAMEQFSYAHTHLISRQQHLHSSLAEILLPAEYHANLQQKDIIIIQTKEPILAQVCRQSKSRAVENISILRRLSDIANVEYEPGYKFKSTFRHQKNFDHLVIEYVELLVKDMFVSRRDQYKILNELNNLVIYSGKVLNFEGLKLTVMNMMGSNNEVLKRGVIGKTTKIIYRTSCAKYTILVELSKEMFQADINQQIYVEKVIQFLATFYFRNTIFQNNHRVEIVLFSRLYYPQFQNLNQAYDAVVEALREIQQRSESASKTKKNCTKEADTSHNRESQLSKQSQDSRDTKDKYSINFAIAFQVDSNGKIYEDAYRKIVWKKSYGNIGSYIWKKIGEFLYTINWKRNVKPVANFILKRVKKEMDKHDDNISESSGSSSKRKGSISNLGDANNKIRPFIRSLECELADSCWSNMLEAITLTAAQYSKHFYGRSVVESGNAITILSAGNNHYFTDETTYRLAKIKVYLTNISCILVNFRNCDRKRVEFTRFQSDKENLIHNSVENNTKIDHLIYDCLEEVIYDSPLNQTTVYEHNYFQNRMAISLNNLVLLTPDNQHEYFKNFKLEQLKCKHAEHFVMDERRVSATLKCQQKTPEWIDSCYFSQEAFKSHHMLYDKNTDEIKMYNSARYSSFKGNKDQYLRIYQTFEKLNSSTVRREFQFGREMNKLESRIATTFKKNPETGVVTYEPHNLSRDLFRFQVIKMDQGRERSPSATSYSSYSSKLQHNLYEDPQAFLSRSNLSSISSRKGLLNNITSPLERTTFEAPEERINIFEVDKYEASDNGKSLFLKAAPKKHYISHYKCRLKRNYMDSRIHYLMPQYKEQTVKLLKNTFLRKDEDSSEHRRLFELEYFWKLICFPVLTPIKTSYNILSQYHIQRNSQAKDNVDQLEELICQKLTQNFLIVEQPNQKTSNQIQKIYHLAKGDLYYAIIIQDRVNLNVRECQITDQRKYSSDSANLIHQLEMGHSDMLYSYLCYEEKEYRFVGRHTYFKDDNTWKKDETVNFKSIKISFVVDISNEQTVDREKYRNTCKQNFKEYLQAINDRYQPFIPQFNIKVEDGPYDQQSTFNCLRIQPKKLYPDIKIYTNDQFFFYYENVWNIKNTFNIEIKWTSCMSGFVNDFLKVVLHMGKFSKKISPFLVPSHDVFAIQWNFEAPAELVFKYVQSMQILEVMMEEDWVWDRCGYYFHKRGFGFVKFYKQKKMVLWKDNNREILDANETPDNVFYNFFKKTCCVDILGEIIHNLLESRDRKRQNLNPPATP